MSEGREKKSGGDKGNLTDDNIVQHLLNVIAKNPKRIRTALMDSSSQNMEKPPSHTYSSESGSSEYAIQVLYLSQVFFSVEKNYEPHVHSSILYSTYLAQLFIMCI